MASRTTTDPIEILLEMGVDLDNLSSEEDYLSALMEAAATIEFQTKGSGDERSAVLRKEIIEVRKKRKAADPKFKARTAKISKSSFKPKAKPAGPKALPTSALVPYKKPEEEKQPKSEQKKEKIKSDKSQGLLESILKNVVGIKELIKKRIDITKSIRDIERKNLQKQKRKAKEDRLEEDKKGKNFLKKLKGAVPRLSVFDMIFNWIKNVIMGRILVKIIDWMGDPKNKKKLESLGRFLKDWWPALTAAFVLFATPLGAFIRTVVSGMVRLSGFLLKKAIPTLLRLIAKNPIAALALATVGTTAVMAYNASRDGTAVIKDPKKPDKSHLDEIMESGGMTGDPMGGLFSGGGGVPDWLAMAGGGNAFMKPMGTDTVPAMLSPGEFVMSKGAVDKFGSDFMESINAAGGGTNRPKIMGGTTYAQGGGSIIASDAKTTYYDPSEGGINASGHKVESGPDKGLPATSTGEAYKPEVFSAAAFPPLIKLLPDDMTQPTRNKNWGGIGKTIKSPFQVVVTKGDKSAVVRVNDVGPGVEGHSDNHMLDFSVATKNYLGTGTGGYTIHMAKSNAPLGPITGDKKITDYTIEFKGVKNYGGYQLPNIDSVPAFDSNKTDYQTGDLVKNKPGTPDGSIMVFDGQGWQNAQDPNAPTAQGTVKNTLSGKSASSYDDTSLNQYNDRVSRESSGSGVALEGVDFSTLKSGGGAFSDMFAEARANLGTKAPNFTPVSKSSSSTSSSPSSSSTPPKINPTKVTNNPTNLTSTADFNLGGVKLDPTMQLKDLPGGMDANQLARAHAKSNNLNPEQTELLAMQAVKFAKKNGRAPTKSEINKLTVNIFGDKVGQKVTDSETLKLIDEEKNINKSKLTPIPLDKVAPTDKLKPVKKDKTEVINNPPLTQGAQQDPNNRANVANDPDFPTVSQSREAKEVRQMVLANTLGGDFA